ncbi:DUF4365 domain-containing protein [Demequina sp. TMPB413]|nr:DUF4365 domain-containing protein [Demequina sp. TMPB413]
MATDRREHDYGIDVDVEITSNGQLTGLGFAVQLKATSEVKSGPQVRIRVETLNYWRALDQLVLLVLWDASSDTFWCRWAHRIDPYRNKPGQKTMTVTFTADDQLSAAAWSQLEAEVAAARELKRGYAQFPLRVRLRAQGSVGGNSAGQIKVKALRALRVFDALVDADATEVPHVDVRIARDEIHFQPPGRAGGVLHYGTGRGGASIAPDRLVSDICLAIAHELDALGYHDASTPLVLGHWRQSTMAYQGLHGFAVRTLAAYGSIDDAISLAKDVDDSPDAVGPVSLVALSLMPGAFAWRDRLAEEIRQWVMRRHRDASPEVVRIALDRARQLVASEDHDRAYELALYAEDLDSTLADDPHWQRQIAGHAFLSSRYSDAAARYEIAVEAGDLSASALLGDALLWSGRYLEAAEIWKADNSLEGEYRAKARCFEPLRGALEIAEQARDSFEAEMTWAPGEHSWTTCVKALRHDMLFAPALSWLADQLLSPELFDGEPQPESDSEPEGVIDALRGFEYHVAVCAALAYPTLPGLWQRVILIAPLGDATLYRDVVMVANRMCGAEIIDFLYEQELNADAEMVAEIFADYGVDRKPGSE